MLQYPKLSECYRPVRMKYYSATQCCSIEAVVTLSTNQNRVSGSAVEYTVLFTSTSILQGLESMEPIVAAARTMLESSTGLIQTARSLAVNPKDPPKWSVLAGHSRTVSDSIKKLITNMRYGQTQRHIEM